MECFDDCVRPSSARFGCETGEIARTERTNGWHQPHEPRPKWDVSGGRRDLFACGAQWHVSAPAFENDPLHQFDPSKEERADQAGSRSNERGSQERAPKQLE
jgi:hypothetical protein